MKVWAIKVSGVPRSPTGWVLVQEASRLMKDTTLPLETLVDGFISARGGNFFLDEVFVNKIADILRKKFADTDVRVELQGFTLDNAPCTNCNGYGALIVHCGVDTRIPLALTDPDALLLRVVPTRTDLFDRLADGDKIRSAVTLHFRDGSSWLRELKPCVVCGAKGAA